MRITLRLAAATVGAVVSVSPVQAKMEQRAADLSRAYLEAWSFDTTAALRHVGELYAPRIRFYGRDLHRAALYVEKRRFIQRWPIRRYALRPGTVSVTCKAHRCTVTGLMDWRAASPSRHAVAHGASRFVQTFDLSTGTPLIVAETGSVLQHAQRGSRAVGAIQTSLVTEERSTRR